jgi:hypothetical protein
MNIRFISLLSRPTNAIYIVHLFGLDNKLYKMHSTYIKIED